MPTGIAQSETTRQVTHNMDVALFPQEYYRCRKPERLLNACMFEKLVRLLQYNPRAALQSEESDEDNSWYTRGQGTRA